MADERTRKYAEWLIANEDKKGTPEFETVAQAYKRVRTAPTPEQAATAADIMASFNASEGRPQTPEQPQRNRQGNPVSRFIGQFADEKVLPGAPGSIAQGVAGAMQGIAEKPVQSLVVDPLTAPTRIIPPTREIVPNLAQGKFAEAGKNVADAATAAGETALLAGGPIASAGGRAGAATAKPVARSAGEQLVDDAARVGVDVTAPVAFPKTAGAAAKPLSENLFAGGTTRRGADKTLRQLEDAATRQADDFSPGATIDDAGSAAREGAKRFNSRSMITPDESATITQPARASTFRDKAEALYNKAYRGFNAEATATPQATVEALERVNSRFSNEGLQAVFELPTAKKLQSVLTRKADGAIRTQADDLLEQAMAVQRQSRSQQGVSLADFVRKRGGVKDVGGDALNAIGNTVRGRPGLVNNSGGRQVDDLIVEAVEEGYFPSANLDQGILPTQREFLDALTNDVQGRRVFAQGDDAARAGNADLDRLTDELSRLGVDPRARGDELIRQVEAATGEKVSGAQLTVADMRALRTEIRDIQNTGKFLKTKDDAALERLESALTDDIYDAVKASGGDQALSRLKRADRFYRLGTERMRKALEPFLKDKATDETAVQSILRASKGQGKGDIQRLRALRRSLRPEEMDDISAGILREMGRAKEGADFSPEVFTRNWATMGDEAKATLFSRAQRPEVRQNLDALARVIERQSKIEQFSNRSQSGVSLQNIATVGGFVAEPITGTVALLGANAFGRAMMSPTFTKLLLQLNRNTARATRAGANLASEKARVLAMIAAAEQSDAAIKPYTQELRAALEASNDNATAATRSSLERPLPRLQPE